jgi:deoxyribonuclease-4
MGGENRRLGVHTSIQGGLSRALLRAQALGCSAVQIFTHSPRGWTLRPISARQARGFQALRKELRLSPLCVHASYLVHLASSSALVRRRSVWLLRKELQRAQALAAEYLIVHVGPEPSALRACLKEALREGPFRVGLLLENTAKGPSPGTLLELAQEVGARGLCLDSCHAFAQGYDLRSPRGLGSLLKELPPEAVRLIHLNDSRAPLGSGIDRHAHLGRGHIGLEGLRALLQAYPQVPVILETPRRNDRDDLRNLQQARELIRTQSLPQLNRS